jgi:hypothetical protein
MGGKMENKFIYVGIAIILILLIGSVILSSGLLNQDVVETKNMNGKTNQNLEKYRSSKIPEECRLPGYENDVESWKEHLSHHKETWHCLDYYE